MEDLVRQLMSDYQEAPVPVGIYREVHLPVIQRKANVITGMRRSGKTFVLFQEMRRLMAAGIPKTRMLHINFEDERLLGMETRHLRLIPETFYRLFPQSRRGTSYFFFDEMQNIPGWEQFVRRLLDSEDVRIYLTGSSSKLLSSDLATSMRGRSIETHLLPFSFREVLRCEGVEAPTNLDLVGKDLRSRLENLCERYLLIGGFPEVQPLSDFDRRQVLQGYVNVVIFRDVIERYGVTNVALLRRLIQQLLSNPAGMFTVHKFYCDTKSQGLRCSKNTVFDYLDYLQDCFMVHPVELWAESERRRQTNPWKMYPADTGLSEVYRFHHKEPSGQLLETAVLVELLRRQCAVHYVRTSGGYEVDFLVEDPCGGSHLIQVCAELSSKQTALREERSLRQAMNELKQTTGTIVTLVWEETRMIDEGTLHLVPAWKWLLGTSTDAPDRNTAL
ncbi:MAG: ATP-binding protein [Armatimonadetes bacterium]|nr:ATP-binding protein [Armatimonadota bacterium]